MLEKIIHKIALTCKEATLLMELKDTNAIKPLQKIRLLLHLQICKYCRLYNKKRIFISNYFQKKEQAQNLNTADAQRIDQLKKSINKRLTNLEDTENE